MMTQLVLSLFPGADLFGKAFEAEGFCVVRGPDVLLGGDIREFHAPPGRFDGIIGGPPCQVFSNAARIKSRALNLIPEFIRIVEEAQPKWAVMENVWGARVAAPDWPHVRFSDADVGGPTKRVRAFWFYGLPPAPKPVVDRAARRAAAYAVLATNWRQRENTQFNIHHALSVVEAARLQGVPAHFPRRLRRAWKGAELSANMINRMGVMLLGNGVPLPMGRYIARHVRAMTEGDYMASWANTGLPLFSFQEAA